MEEIYSLPFFVDIVGIKLQVIFAVSNQLDKWIIFSWSVARLVKVSVNRPEEESSF